MAKNAVKDEDIIPDIGPFEFYIESFSILSTCRISIMDISPIPFSAIVEYSKIYGLVDEEFEDFIYIIREMDAELIELNKAKKSNGRSNKNNHRKS